MYAVRILVARWRKSSPFAAARRLKPFQAACCPNFEMPVTLPAMTSARFPAHRSPAFGAAALTVTTTVNGACAFADVKKAKQPLI